MASLLRKFIRPKSRSKSPVKYPLNHVGHGHGSEEELGEDGWPGRSPGKANRKNQNHTAQWNPVTGRFETVTSPKRASATFDDPMAKPSNYLASDDLTFDEQRPSGSNQTQTMHRKHPDHVHASPHSQPHYSHMHSLSKHAHQRRPKHEKPPTPTLSPTLAPTTPIASSEGYYASIPPLANSSNRLHVPPSPSLSNRFGSTLESPGSARRTYLTANEVASRESGDYWSRFAGVTLMQTSQSNPESTATTARPSKEELPSLKYPPGNLPGRLVKGTDATISTRTLTTPDTRPRSTSPRKSQLSYGKGAVEERPYRSRSPAKKPSQSTARTFNYLQAQCKLEGCCATIVVEESRFLVCKHQLSHASDFFRSLFLNNRALPIEGVQQMAPNEYTIVVSALRHPSQSQQFRWFMECTIPNPMIKDITEDALETCMRLSKRFSAKGLELRCSKYILEKVESKPPMMALCWLNWAFKHRFHRTVREASLPVVARLSLVQLEKHRQMLPESIYADILAMKLRTAYQQTTTVFHTIHRLDHFHVDVDKCLRCGRQREQGKIRALASPCHKLIGCERCMREFGCEIEQKGTNISGQPTTAPMQAFYQCEHGLWPFGERTEDCQCQTKLYRASLAGQPLNPELAIGSGTSPSTSTKSTTTLTRNDPQQSSNLTLASRGQNLL